MASKTWTMETPAWFRLKTVVFSHGWYDLPPFQWDPTAGVLRFVGRVSSRVAVIDVAQSKPRRLEITLEMSGRLPARTEEQGTGLVEKTLGLSHDFGDFYRLAGPEYAWAQKLGAGPFLRGASVFEDAVKMMATTNCSWSLTRQMVHRLIEELGEKGPAGVRAFPTPEQMAERSVEFYRDTIRTGYRSRFFHGLAEMSANGEADPEGWSSPEHSTEELTAKIRTVPGLGRYAAENLCKLLGRFDGLGLDSWCLKKYPLVHGPVRGDVTKAIVRRYERFGRWKGLALWLDLTRDWHEKPTIDDSTTHFQKA